MAKGLELPAECHVSLHPEARVSALEGWTGTSKGKKKDWRSSEEAKSKPGGVFCSVGQSSGNTQNRAKLICQEFLMQADTTINYHIIHLHLCFTAPFPPRPPSRDELLVYRTSLFTPTF